MNGLTLRISRTGNNKTKNSSGFSPVSVILSDNFIHDEKPDCIKKFIESSSADEQLIVLKKILEELENNYDSETIQFLVTIFFDADAKHPIKCFLARYISKTTCLHQPFTNSLVDKISSCIIEKPKTYSAYIDIVSKVSTCIENFSPGVAAIKSVEINLAKYLHSCLECCTITLKELQISPTEKNELFNLAHLALRLFLYLVQKVNMNNTSVMISMFNDIRLIIQQLLYDDDVPMDTKSVCGILYLSMQAVQDGPDSWIEVLYPQESNEILHELLNHEASQLSLYSAIATIVSMDKLERYIAGKAAVVLLVEKVLEIAERSSSESVFVLGVTRTLVQISKSVEKLTDSDLGLKLVDHLLLFVWGHLDHYMDSVRHLTAQSLGCIVKYCSKLRGLGNDHALNSLFEALTSLDRTRKSYYLSLASLTNELGAVCLMERVPNLIKDLLHALGSQPVQASATNALEILLQKHIRETNSETIKSEWIDEIISYVSDNSLDTGVLNILENLLAKAVKLDDNCISYIVLYIKQYQHSSASRLGDMRCVLILLNVMRKSGYTSGNREENEGEWKGIISYEVLKEAAVNSLDEIRILSLTLIVESPKTTEIFTTGDFQFVLWYLKYNINAQAPNFRQLSLSVLKKFIKRLEDSYKVVERQKESTKKENYLDFVESLRELCFESLIEGANYSRRYVALQLLVWCERLNMDGLQRIWNFSYINKLLVHLEDSYESNKAMVLEILQGCPVELLKDDNFSISLEMMDILRQASSLKPTDCISAAYKLDFLRRMLPERILDGEMCKAAEPVTFRLVEALVERLRLELAVCAKSVVCAAREAPIYGILYCIRHFIQQINPESISGDKGWRDMIDGIITTCVEVNASVASVVNNSSPEGHLPMDMSDVIVTDYGNSGCVSLDDGRQVTAQMVLLCAWRSVKEVSLLLGTISSRMSISGEGREVGTLTFDQVDLMTQHFTKLLAETKHRGAFEQAYVGFTKLLSRLWRSRSPRLHELPRTCLSDLMEIIASNDGKTSLCATRRSAGLPFMIQALVTTELEVDGNPKCFHSCMATLLRLARARAVGGVEARAHCLNVLRALYRSSALDESVAPYVGEGLLVALAGFEGETWAERNSSTLLFSALMVRIFGVQRSRDGDRLSIRNRMTGRIFFLRYPRLYDFMLEKLKEVSSNENTKILRPSLYPILLLLARLYPSSLEGTVSNLKLVAYVPHVMSCANSSVMKTRQLAAKAMIALVSPENYLQHLGSMFRVISDPSVRRNYCHGILLQISKLLGAKPNDLVIEESSQQLLSNSFAATLWIIQNDCANPCYLLIDEYMKVINLLIWRFPNIIQPSTINIIIMSLTKLIFQNEPSIISPGKEICLSNALYVLIILLNKYQIRNIYHKANLYHADNILEIIYKALKHTSYEVTLACLNYLLITHEKLQSEDIFHEHIKEINHSVLLNSCKDNLRYLDLLCDVLSDSKCIECQQKSLNLLTLQGNTQHYILQIDHATPDCDIVEKLFVRLSNCHGNVTHLYLESLCDFIETKIDVLVNSSQTTLLEVLRVVLDCASSDNGESTRSVVVKFLERNLRKLLLEELDELNPQDLFASRATLWSIIITMLEDDDQLLRQRTSNAVMLSLGDKADVVPSKCGDAIMEYIEKREDTAVLVMLALLDFKSEVCLTDDGNDECRVFDQNERYNVFLEETKWTVMCSRKIIEKHKNIDASLIDYIVSIIDNAIYRGTFESLCLNNVIVMKNVLRCENPKSCVINPKVQIFIDLMNK